MKEKRMRIMFYALCFLLWFQLAGMPAIAITGASSNNNLKALAITGSNLLPAFSPDQTEYVVIYDNTAPVITITGTAEDPAATVSINGGNGPLTLPLGGGRSSAEVVVQAEDGSTKTYSLTVYSGDSLSNGSPYILSNLTVNSGTLSPTFNPLQPYYGIELANEVTQLEITAETQQAASVYFDPAVAKEMYIPWGKIGSVPLDVGFNMFEIQVGEGGFFNDPRMMLPTKSYYIIAYRQAAALLPASDNKDLSGLTISQGTLAPEFDGAVLDYTASVAADASAITVTGLAADDGASVSVNGGTASQAIRLTDQVTEIPILVTAEDGSSQTYSLTVTKEDPVIIEKNNLARLTLKGGTLYPAFSPDQTEYLIVANPAAVSTDPNTISLPQIVTLAAAPETAGAIVTVADIKGNLRNAMIGGILMSDDGSRQIEFYPQEDDLYFRFDVTPPDGSRKSYFIKVVNEQPEAAKLSGLTLSQGTLSPEFDPETSDYTVTVAYDTEAITVTALTEAVNATVSVNGKSDSEEILLAEKETKIEILIEAEYQTDQKTYTVTVTKEDEPTVSRMHHIVSERTCGGRTLARFDDSCFGLIVEEDESGMFDYKLGLRTMANDVRIQIPYADLMGRMAEGARDLLVTYQGQEIRIPMSAFEGDWLAGMPCQTEPAFEIHMTMDEAGQATYTMDFFVVEQIDEMTRLVHRKRI